jgi:hypothetical protein
MTEAQTIRQLKRRPADSEECAGAIQKIDVLNNLA